MRARSVREVYSEQARNAAHGEHWAGPAEMVDRIASVLEITSDSRVLDLGSGIGGPARRLAEQPGCRVVGVDVVEEVVRAAACRSSSAAFLVASVTAPPFRSGSFDRLISLGVAAHAGDVRALTAAAARVLDPTGHAAFTEAFWDGVRETAFERVAPRPWRPLTTSELRSGLFEAGFSSVEILPWPGGTLDTSRVGDDALRADLLEGRLFSAMVVARKK